jgi:hypothetical protein
MDSEETLKYL